MSQRVGERRVERGLGEFERQEGGCWCQVKQRKEAAGFSWGTVNILLVANSTSGVTVVMNTNL